MQCLFLVLASICGLVDAQQCTSASGRHLGSGNHYKDVKHSSPDQCCQACQHDVKCKSFTYFVTKQHHCYFFDNDDDTGPIKVAGHQSYRKGSGPAPGPSPPTPPSPPSPPHRALDSGFVVATIPGLKSPDDCNAACVNQTVGTFAPKTFDVPNCEAWQFTPSDGTCELRQLTGDGELGALGDLSGVSWKRHANFRGDCTPLWVDIAPKQTQVAIETSGKQHDRDLACCRACTASETCEAWSQGTDLDDKDQNTCWLRQVTTLDIKHASKVVGAAYHDSDYPTKKPKPYYTERRNMVCSDIGPRFQCGDDATQRDTCQSFGCCWDDNKFQCFRSSWRPVVIMHGMGSRLVEYEKNIIWLRKQYPGIYIKNLNVYPGPPSQLTHMDAQLARIRQAVESDPLLSDGFNFYGESQGGLQARAYVSLYNDPPVYNLIAISGPQEGVGLCPTIDMPIIKQVCADGAPIIDIYHWPKCSFCDYWHGLNEDKYKKNSQWLVKVNNALDAKDPSIPARMKTLNFYMASAGSDDKVVQPRESAWHTFWPWGGPQKESAVMDWRKTDSYLGDWLGLQTLDAQGKLEFNMYEGGHTKYNSSWWLATVLPVFNNKLSGLQPLASVGNEYIV